MVFLCKGYHDVLLSLPKDWLLDLSEIDTLPVRYCLDVPVVDILVKTQIKCIWRFVIMEPRRPTTVS